jgi:hypothetical protein
LQYRNKSTLGSDVLDEKKSGTRLALTEENLDGNGARLEASPKAVASFGSSMTVGRMYSSHWQNISKVTALQIYSRTQHFTSRSWPRNYVLF